MDPRGVSLYPPASHQASNNNNKPRYRVYSVVRRMNPSQQQHQQQQQQQIMRVPKQEMSRRYVQQTPPNQQRQANQQQQQNQRQNGSGGGKSGGKGMQNNSSVTIEEVPNNSYLDQLLQNNSTQQKVDEDKLPVFLIKLWNIVEDSNLQSIVHWDESGASFHIADPYSFCRNVLPHFFKHNNLNSLIRQLNMYGFRKMTPLSQGGLTRTESDQDHLEFSHPCFVQGRPELLSQIKRKVRDTQKQSAKTAEDKQVNEQTQQSLDIVMAEMRSMREKAKNMEDKMSKLTKENRDMWNQMGAMRQQHARQQQYFKKLLHFLVSVMQPGLSKRVAKSNSRGVLEIDFGASNNMPNGSTPTKRQRMNSEEGPYKDVCDLLEAIQRDSKDPLSRRFSNNDHGGPLISEVTDEFGNSPAGRNDLFQDFNTDRVQSSRYSDTSNSREASPHPIVQQPSSMTSGNGMEQHQHHRQPPQQQQQQQKPQDMYMGSGALTHENVHRSATKRDYSQMGDQNGSGAGTSSGGRASQKRAPYKQANRNLNQVLTPQDYQSTSTANNYNYNTMPAQLTYQPMPPAQPAPQKSLMAIEDPHQNCYSPTLGLSPSFDRQLSQELQDYLSGMDTSMDSIRDMVNNHNWDNFGDDLPEDDDEQYHLEDNDHHEQMNGGAGPSGIQQGGGGVGGQYPLALKNSPENQYYDDAAGELLDPILGDHDFQENGFQIPFPGSHLFAAPR